MNPLDHEEQEILEAFAAVALRSVATAAERSRLEASVRDTPTKDERINLRLTSEDLGALRACDRLAADCWIVPEAVVLEGCGWPVRPSPLLGSVLA